MESNLAVGSKSLKIINLGLMILLKNNEKLKIKRNIKHKDYYNNHLKYRMAN